MVPRASGPVFMFSAPGHIFGGAEGVGSRFHVLRSQTCFSWYRGRRVTFSCFDLPDSFSAVRRVPGFNFMWCTPVLIFGGTEGVMFRFHVLRSWTHFRWYRGRRFPFSYFALLDSFSTVPSASGHIFLFCVPGLVFDGTKGIRFRFHLFRSRTCFWRCGGRRVLFSCFALPYTFLAVPRASGPVFLFCTPGLVFGGTEGVGSHFFVLRSRTCFRRYGGCGVMFSCFACPNSFSAVSRASSPVFMFCAPGHVFGVTEGVRSRFHVLRC
jgi:hypothetical protein